MSDDFDYDVKPVSDDFKAFLVDGASLTVDNGYPIIEDWMISKEIPNRLVPFDKIKEVDDISDCYVCFYCNDKALNRVRRNPKQYMLFFSKAKGIIGLDFSIFTDQPFAVQLYQLYCNLAYTFYYGFRHIPVIPNIRLGDSRTDIGFFEAIPKNSIVAIGTYGFNKTKEEKKRINSFIEELIHVNKPRHLIVYGSLTNEAKINLSKNGIKYYLYSPWISMTNKGLLYERN